MINHIVNWKLKENAEGKDKTENARLIKTKLEGLKTVIEEIEFIEVGINSPEAPKSNYDVVLISLFKDFGSLDRYQVHPAHQEAASFIKKVVEARVAVDYEKKERQG